MSIVVSLLLVLLLFSSHAIICDARSFGVLREEIASKENMGLNPARVSTQPEREAAIPDDATRDIAEEEISRFEKDKADSEHKTHIDEAKGDRVEVSGTRKSESVASVSWRVPHKKGGQPEAGFNLDYLPPKTHPPVHN